MDTYLHVFLFLLNVEVNVATAVAHLLRVYWGMFDFVMLHCFLTLSRVVHAPFSKCYHTTIV